MSEIVPFQKAKIIRHEYSYDGFRLRHPPHEKSHWCLIPLLTRKIGGPNPVPVVSFIKEKGICHRYAYDLLPRGLGAGYSVSNYSRNPQGSSLSEPCFLIRHSSPWVAAIYSGTEWRDTWMDDLFQLPGAAPYYENFPGKTPRRRGIGVPLWLIRHFFYQEG